MKAAMTHSWRILAGYSRHALKPPRKHGHQALLVVWAAARGLLCRQSASDDGRRRQRSGGGSRQGMLALYRADSGTSEHITWTWYAPGLAASGAHAAVHCFKLTVQFYSKLLANGLPVIYCKIYSDCKNIDYSNCKYFSNLLFFSTVTVQLHRLQSL